MSGVQLTQCLNSSWKINIPDFLGTGGFASIKAETENLLLPLRTKFSSNTKRFEFVGSLLRHDELGLDADLRAVSTALAGLTQNLVKWSGVNR